MPNENTYEAKHVIVPVYHSGDDAIHNIAVPAGTPLPELHDALVTAGYHSGWAPYQGANVDSFGRPKAGPTKQGVLENSPQFKSIAKAVFEKSDSGRSPDEAGTYIDEDGRGPISVSDTEGHMSLSVPKTATATIHSHPLHFHGAQASPLPSDQDVATAKKLNGPACYVVSPEGLSVVEKDGKITNIYNSKDWFDHNNK